MIKKHQLNIIVFGVILVLSIFMFGSNFQAKFSVIDDHNIVSLVGNDNNFSKNDVLSFLKNEQDFQIGSYGRFRPSLQVGRAIEMYLFEDNALYYQIARFSLFVSLVFIFSVFIIQKVGVLYGSIISLILISESAWRDIFTRIITSEIYTIYGLVVFIPASIGIFNVIKNNVEYKSKIKLFTVAILYFVFGLLSIGSKENFIFMIVVPIVILFWSYKSNNTDFFNRLINLISIVLIGYGLFIATVMVMYFINTNDDVTGYGLFTGGETLIKIAYNFIEMFFINWMAVLLIFPYLFLLVIKGNDKYDRIKKWSLQLYIYIFLLSLLLIFQVIYYTGSLPTGTRYDFPSIFFYSLYLILIS